MISKRQTSIRKNVSNADRSAATSRAKRDAAVAARRGLRTTNKASKMEIETAVKKQANKTAIQKANKQNATKHNTAHLPPKEKFNAKKEQREIQKAGKKAAKQENVALKPTLKQIKAARKAMVEAGYQFPANHVLSVVPKKPEHPPAKKQPTKQKKPNKRNPKKN